MTGRRVCDHCCYKCEHRASWSGLWKCEYTTPEDRKEAARKRAQQRFDDENLKISRAFYKRKKEEAKQRAIKAAKARARQKRQNPGGSHK
jgi:hypothetical protein